MAMSTPGHFPVSFAEAQITQSRFTIEITIDKRANPADPPLVVAGILTISLNVHTGKFTGVITPGIAQPPDALPNTEGTPQTVVLFDVVNGTLMPHEGVMQLTVDGQIQGAEVS